MKKYLIKGICFIVLLIGVDFAAGKVFSWLHRLAFERSPYGFVTEYALYRMEADIVVIGSSRACHHYVPEILADRLGMKVHNCGKDGSFFLSQCCVIDGILSRLKPKAIIWDIEPSCLSASDSDNRLSDLNPFYDGNSFCRKVIDQSSPAERYKMMSRTYRYNSRILAYLYKSMVPFNYPADGYLPFAADGYKYPSLRRDKHDDFLKETLSEYLIQIVKKCKIGGVNLILSFSPCFTEDNYRELSSYRKLCRIATQEGISLIDFFHDPTFMGDSTLFKDNIHLNDNGARKFTVKLAKKLRCGM